MKLHSWAKKKVNLPRRHKAPKPLISKANSKRTNYLAAILFSGASVLLNPTLKKRPFIQHCMPQSLDNPSEIILKKHVHFAGRHRSQGGQVGHVPFCTHSRNNSLYSCTPQKYHPPQSFIHLFSRIGHGWYNFNIEWFLR